MHLSYFIHSRMTFVLALVFVQIGDSDFAFAVDIELTPPAGGAVVIKDGVNNRMLIYRDGRVEITGLPGADQQDQVVCFDSLTGELGRCLSSALGSQGPQGVKGDPGPQGAQGVQGLTGNDGTSSVAGPKGDQGPPGGPGPTGDPGPVGPSIQNVVDQPAVSCDDGTQGLIRWTGSNLEFCTGTAWNTITLISSPPAP